MGVLIPTVIPHTNSCVFALPTSCNSASLALVMVSVDSWSVPSRSPGTKIYPLTPSFAGFHVTVSSFSGKSVNSQVIT